MMQILLAFPQRITDIDIRILDYIQEHLRNGFFDKFFSVITHLADKGIFWILLALVLLCFKRTRRTGFCMAIALVLGVIFGNLLLKPLIARIRPYDLNPHMWPGLVGKPDDFSFPSGHTLASFGGATALCRVNRKAGIPAIILAALIMLSRVYLYVHYPSDVLTGMLMGILFGCIAPILWDKIGERVFVSCWNFIFRNHKIERV